MLFIKALPRYGAGHILQRHRASTGGYAVKHQEADQHVCPMSLASGKATNCIGLRCAAWRWREPKFGSVDTRKGYCGLAGEAKYPVNPENE